ncbi:hypothetical protein [Xenorhabdus szentirmaii]|uniref:Uncharacterized protein n=1 Tax=Xenorhabdus szentirmaii DSM 16338 TaxID=1427518 RepID=W1J5N9_9GAMM|nr:MULTISPECIES: hypothetical protein [Xenorhabdus]MBD2803458.1 hypothetical protein [Xenorhabdus sp. ZM]PHM31968.1 hypothetical protein Xsze_02696 [Xenorhabdus szentirmaii DSM 16338]CDL85373.1 hypothetical protein XSR1_70112 [Xenorhabdus szentirmaii DSM 16338]
MDTVFYAVCNDVGVCNFNNDKYQTLKAVFFDKSDAELMVNNSDKKLIVVPVYLEDARG